jgi:hypothetical protein
MVSKITLERKEFARFRAEILKALDTLRAFTIIGSRAVNLRQFLPEVFSENTV